jgi:hypothetical protein
MKKNIFFLWVTFQIRELRGRQSDSSGFGRSFDPISQHFFKYSFEDFSSLLSPFFYPLTIIPTTSTGNEEEMNVPALAPRSSSPLCTETLEFILIIW